MSVNKFQRGQIWWYINNGSYDGSVQGKTRPMIIISNNLANKYSNNLIAVPCTTSPKKAMPTHLALDIDGTPSTALCENIMSINVEKLDSYIGTCDEQLIEELNSCIKVALDLEDNISNLLYKPSKPVSIDEFVKSNINQNIVRPTKGRKPQMTIEELREFVNDYESYGADYMITKYDIKNRKCLQQKVYMCRKKLSEVS